MILLNHIKLHPLRNSTLSSICWWKKSTFCNLTLDWVEFVPENHHDKIMHHWKLQQICWKSRQCLCAKSGCKPMMSTQLCFMHSEKKEAKLKKRKTQLTDHLLFRKLFLLCFPSELYLLLPKFIFLPSLFHKYMWFNCNLFTMHEIIFYHHSEKSTRKNQKQMFFIKFLETNEIKQMTYEIKNIKLPPGLLHLLIS